MDTKHRRQFPTLLLAAALMLILGGTVMLAQIFTHYNALSLMRQDVQLQDMARAVDKSIAMQLDNFREDLTYVLNRRGFMQAEEAWVRGEGTEELLYRMQENLVTQNPLTHTLLAVVDGTILLSTNGHTDYTFPAGREGTPLPCFAGDGTMYLAVIAQTSHAEYAALIDIAQWYADLTHTIANDGIRLLLLGSQEKILLHQWLGGTYVNAVEELAEDNCDIQAVRNMLECRNSNRALTTTYHLTYPNDTFVHEMRMATIPLAESVNGYFIVGLTSDYDEIIRPMQHAAIRLLIYGAMVVIGVLLLVLAAFRLLAQGRRRDEELHQLEMKNAQTQRLLEKTQELAHHQRMETIGTLASSIAHEFNNLLTPIMGYSILTLEGLPEDCDELADNVSEIYEASRKAKTIISRLSDLSRRNTEAAFRCLPPDELVQRALTVAAPAQPAQVETVLRLGCGECRILANETQMSQLLLNLIINAYQAMEEKGGVLTLTTEAEADHVLLRVSDTGAGIPEEVLPHIFEPFYTTKESGRGTGLGLAIVQQVAESHRGEIAVESIPGKGCTFTLRLPLCTGKNEES